MIQEEDESLHNYIKRWRDIKPDISNMCDKTTIYVFYRGLKNHELSEKLMCKASTTLASLFQVVDKYAMGEELLRHMSSYRKEGKRNSRKLNKIKIEKRSIRPIIDSQQQLNWGLGDDLLPLTKMSSRNAWSDFAFMI